MGENEDHLTGTARYLAGDDAARFPEHERQGGVMDVPAHQCPSVRVCPAPHRKGVGHVGEVERVAMRGQMAGKFLRRLLERRGGTRRGHQELTAVRRCGDGLAHRGFLEDHMGVGPTDTERAHAGAPRGRTRLRPLL